MIINSEPKDKAIFSGAGAASEFKINNSAKAFGILSSGLYANKIRAIIRELSCNAVDSHVAAGSKEDFDLHLPTLLSPYFSVRDYGIGLSSDDVINVYTTYFESTKADSNDFIGALGLGSKSPFSYTDNFTVIAIKDGMKGVYSAFINDLGVPSVVQMGYEATDERTGVEVKFAVTDHYDFYSFADEARHVFAYFPIKPKFTGADCNIAAIELVKEDIIPGVNQRKITYTRSNLAVMGNIAYPIEIPRGSRAQFSDLDFVEERGLDLHFALGEIEFQASREGLQYTDITVAAIKAKYQGVANALEKIVTTDAEAIENMWERTDYLSTIYRDPLWKDVVRRYIVNNNIPFFVTGTGSYLQRDSITLSPQLIAEKFNISLRVFEAGQSWGGFSNSSDRTAREIKPRHSGSFEIRSDKNVYFVMNPTNEKVWTRSKEHFKSQYKEDRLCYIISASNPDKDVDIDGFAKSIHRPPVDRFLEVEDLVKSVRKKSQEKISILSIRRDSYSQKCTWQPESLKVSDMDANTTYYYVPIVGFAGKTKGGKALDVKTVYDLMRRSETENLKTAKVYGIRDDNIKTVQGLANWVQLDELINKELTNYTKDKFIGSMISWVDSNKESLYYNKEVMAKIDPKSPIRVLHDKLPATRVKGDRQIFDIAVLFDEPEAFQKLEKQAREELSAISSRYPMFALLRSRVFNEPAVIEYIQLVDKQKGLN
jgi:hypothetical protein